MQGIICRQEKYLDPPVKPIKLKVVNLCARSAHTLPLSMILSAGLSFPNRARRAASRRRATFSCGVSPGGAGPPIAILVFRGVGFAVATGAVAVKRWGSFAILCVCGLRMLEDGMDGEQRSVVRWK
jgi:hypothetical protein